jgi:hypothetical protein
MLPCLHTRPLTYDICQCVSELLQLQSWQLLPSVSKLFSNALKSTYYFSIVLTNFALSAHA